MPVHEVHEPKGLQPMPTIAVWLTTLAMLALLSLVALAGRMEHDEIE